MSTTSRVLLTFPNLFVGFLQAKPIVNPNYEQARRLSEEKVSRYDTVQTSGGTLDDI